MITLTQALSMVPEGAMHRDKLAQLLVTVECAFEDTEVARMFRRYQHLAALTALADAARGTPSSHKANAALRMGIDSARTYARRHRLTPNTRQTIKDHARLVLDALR